MEELSRSFDQMNFQQDEKLPLSARACLVQLIQQVEEEKLRQGLNVELKRLLIDHERLVSMLQQRSQLLEQENEHLKTLNDEHQRRYEKAVREMQFFKNKYDNLKKEHHHHHPSPPPPPPPPQQQQPLPPPPPSQQQQQHLSHGLLASYPLTPTSPQPSTISYDSAASQHHPPPRATLPSRSSSASTNSSSSLGLHHLQQQQKQQQQHQQQHGTAASYWPAPPASVVSTESSSTATSGHIPAEPMLRQQPSHPVRHAGTQSIYSVESSFSDRVNNNSNWRPLQHNPSIHSSYSSPSTVSTMSSAAGGPGGSSSTGTSVYSVPMTPVRSTTSANGYTGSSMIQQRRVDPLLFGGSDALWDTIAKSKGSDVTVEKIISNFLRRGGSPNTAKQSPSTGAVKYGYGMIHALVVTKASGALDLLLQQGANPNAMTLSQNEDDKVSPCYVAASVGWLAGLQKLVQAGADLINARGQGSKSKTALHTAAEHCHAAVVEFIVGYTEGALNLITDSQGKKNTSMIQSM